MSNRKARTRKGDYDVGYGKPPKIHASSQANQAIRKAELRVPATSKRISKPH